MNGRKEDLNMVKIISDSSTLYTTNEAAAKGIAVVPLNIVVDQSSYKDLDEMTSTKLLRLIQEKKIPSSSQPSIGEKQACYEQYLEEEQILDITMAQGLSGTYDSACMAKQLVDSDKITVFNSKTLCGPHRALVDYAKKLSDQGMRAQEIVDSLASCVETEISFLVPRDFSFLKRGGRVSQLEAGVGGFLKLVPTMIKSANGKRLESFCVTKTFKKAVKNMIAEMKKRQVDSSYTFFISHAFNEDDALKAQALIEEQFEGARIVLLPLSPVFIAQGGPECVAVQAIRIA